MHASIPVRRVLLGALALAVCGTTVLGSGTRAEAVADPVGLGTATAFAVLAYSTVTNTGPSQISGDVGLHPGTAVVGFPPGTQTAGAAYIADSVALVAKGDASNAFTTASGQSGAVPTGVELGGLTLTPDLYQSTGVLEINGTLTLDGGNDPSAVFIFRTNSTLTTGSGSSVALINDANPCNVFWIVPSSATLGTNSTLVGTVIASTSITATTGTNVNGRLLALNGAVTLDSTTVSSTGCSPVTVNPGSGISLSQASANTTAADSATAAAAAAAALAATGVEAELVIAAGSTALLGGAILLLVARRRSLARR